MPASPPARWAVALPDGAYEVPVPPPPEFTAMSHLRGDLPPGVPFFGVVTTSERPRGSAVERARALAADFVEPALPRTVEVPGSLRAARVDGRIDLGEGLTPDGIERITVVVAELRREFAVLTLRTRPDDPAADAVEAVVGSFRILSPGAGDAR